MEGSDSREAFLWGDLSDEISLSSISPYQIFLWTSKFCVYAALETQIWIFEFESEWTQNGECSKFQEGLIDELQIAQIRWIQAHMIAEVKKCTISQMYLQFSGGYGGEKEKSLCMVM